MSQRGEPCKVVPIAAARQAREEREQQWEEAVARHLGVAGVWPEDAQSIATELREKLGITLPPEVVAERQLKQMGWIEPDEA